MSSLQVKGHIFNIQSYSIHDGPGIRSTVFVKGCPLNCIWCQNPESKKSQPELMFYAQKCVRCGTCAKVCSVQAVHYEIGEHPITDRRICRACGACVDACPSEAREIAGKTVTVYEALEEVKKDKLFMDGSGGGMTISGGEPLMQPEFTANLFAAAQEEGIHTAIETCNFASRDVVKQVYEHVDLAICDIKHMDSVIHNKLTGVPNEQILDNICYIRNELGKPMMIRTPVVPGYNGDLENIERTALFIRDHLGTDVVYGLLPYHRLGESKSESLELTDFELHVTPPDDSYMQQCVEAVERFGVIAQIGG